MERIICEECSGKITKKKVDYIFLGENIGKFDAEVCNKCGEQIFDEITANKITAVIKHKGLHGLSAKSKIGQIGTSVGVTVNKKIADFMNLKKGEDIVVYPESRKRLVIERT